MDKLIKLLDASAPMLLEVMGVRPLADEPESPSQDNGMIRRCGERICKASWAYLSCRFRASFHVATFCVCRNCLGQDVFTCSHHVKGLCVLY